MRGLCGVLMLLSGLALAGGCNQDRDAAAVSKFPQEHVAGHDIKASLRPNGDLKLTGTREVHLKLDMDAPDIVYMVVESIDGDATPELLRWHSPALYRRLGQASPSYLIYSKNMSENQIRNDPKNSFASVYPIIAPESKHELDLAALQGRIQSVNELQVRTTCNDDDGASLLSKVEAKTCAVACSGQSVIIGQLAGVPTKVLLLEAPADIIAPGVNFTRSEGHTTVEVVGQDGWQVFDPTFGFAWVKRNGRRLDTKGLIDALADGQESQLTFGALHFGKIHAVPGPDFLKYQPTLKPLYYTPDKVIVETAYGSVAQAAVAAAKQREQTPPTRIVSSESLDGYSATNVLRRDQAGWLSQKSGAGTVSGGSWVGIDYGAIRPMAAHELEIVWTTPETTPPSVSVENSWDGVTWTPVIRFDTSKSADGKPYWTQTVTFENRIAVRYWRVTPAASPAGQFGVEFLEFRG